MGFFDGLFGRKKETDAAANGPLRFGSEPMHLPASSHHSYGQGYGMHAGQLTDEQALQRYNYMIQHTPKEKIEQAHEEAFAKMTPDQRIQVLQGLSAHLTSFDRMSLNPNDPDPKLLARVATRAELRSPGTMAQTFSNPAYAGHGHGHRSGMGGMMAGILGAVVLGVVGSMIAAEIFEEMGEAFAPEEVAAEAFEEPASYAEESFGGDFGGDFGGEF